MNKDKRKKLEVLHDLATSWSRLWLWV